MPILYDIGHGQYTHHNEVYGVPLYNVTVLFSKLQNSACCGLTVEPELLVPRILLSMSLSAHRIQVHRLQAALWAPISCNLNDGVCVGLGNERRELLPFSLSSSPAGFVRPCGHSRPRDISLSAASASLTPRRVQLLAPDSSSSSLRHDRCLFPNGQDALPCRTPNFTAKYSRIAQPRLPM